MSAKTEEGKQEAGAKGPQSCFEMCHGMMGDRMPECCGPEMKEMISRFMGQFKAKEEGQR
jgi:cytochrome c2